MNVDPMIVDVVERFLADQCPPGQVRRIEQGAAAAALWSGLAELGLPDLLLPEDAGGAAASMSTTERVATACGAAALPVPLAFTLWLRGILHRLGIAAPAGAMTLASGVVDAAGLRCHRVPFAATAQWVLVYCPDGARLLPVAEAEALGSLAGNANTLRRDLVWRDTAAAIVLDEARDWQADGALITAALLAGAARRCLEITVDYANTRSQFGRPIGKFQAIQHQLSVVAEEVFAVRMAVQQAFAGYDAGPQAQLRVAMAKGRASEAAQTIAALCHGVVGAIGITDEFDLHLFTRRLNEWRQDFGSETPWYERVGAALLAGGEAPASALDFLLAHELAA
jgi:alkylation response protein AidB-like acyl-CoA dehydrogenase